MTMKALDSETVTKDLKPRRVWRLDFIGAPMTTKRPVDGHAAYIALKGNAVIIQRVDLAQTRAMTVYIPGADAASALKEAHAFIAKSNLAIQSEADIVEVKKEDILNG